MRFSFSRVGCHRGDAHLCGPCAEMGQQEGARAPLRLWCQVVLSSKRSGRHQARDMSERNGLRQLTLRIRAHLLHHQQLVHGSVWHVLAHSVDEQRLRILPSGQRSHMLTGSAQATPSRGHRYLSMAICHLTESELRPRDCRCGPGRNGESGAWIAARPRLAPRGRNG